MAVEHANRAVKADSSKPEPSTTKSKLLQVSTAMNEQPKRVTRRRNRSKDGTSDPFAERILMFDFPFRNSVDQTVTSEDFESQERLPTSGELRKLMNRETSLRDEYLEELRQKLDNSHYLTRDAAEKSAQHMLDDGEFQR